MKNSAFSLSNPDSFNWGIIFMVQNLNIMRVSNTTHYDENVKDGDNKMSPCVFPKPKLKGK